MNKSTFCPALMVSAPASGQGKTLVTAALARYHRSIGRKVSLFKCGPDFLDPMILARASGRPVYQIDLFMGGEDHIRAMLYQAAQTSDLILVEGVMGLYDGNPSTADLAARFGLPVLGVIDGSAMAQSFGALAHGLATYRDDVTMSTVLANRVGGERHAAMLKDSLKGDIRWLGAIARDESITLPERHLGLVQASEIDDIEHRLERSAALLPEEAKFLPEPVQFDAPNMATETPLMLDGTRIAIAQDEAFAFIYPANIELLKGLGAEVVFFSPLSDSHIPDCDAIWLPGGYPELHLKQLSNSLKIIEDLRDHHARHTPILAECGGMLFCVDTLENSSGKRSKMAGLMEGHAKMQTRLSALGLQQIDLPSGTLCGHSFHYSKLETPLMPIGKGSNPNGGVVEPVYRSGSLMASYIHFYFPSNPAAVAAIFTRETA
ncbi:MAG: cobyrinate a,c-diamide synthase [Parasphingorhabdus sp.]|uniref:cobyrinate a,c-diamide synthase n=1 Tax=Parasphingorhabdus sp. TaxID=2709688 RepID=UPI00300349D0